jgi:hypothetical protein
MWDGGWVYSAEERSEFERTGVRPGYEEQAFGRGDGSASRRRLKFLACLYVFSGLVALATSTSHIIFFWANVLLALLSLIAAAAFWVLASAARPSPLLVNTAIAAACVRVIGALAVAFTAFQSGFSVLITGIVLPILVAGYAIVTIRRIATDGHG